MDSSTVASIECLPAELLTRIFLFVYHDEYCLAPYPNSSYHGDRDRPHTHFMFPEQPDTLVHVCSTWRRVALATSFLWSHIDIVIDHSQNHNLFNRAKVYAERAGHHAIDIHLCDPGSERERQKWMARQPHTAPSGYEDLHEFKFLDADMVSIRSLILDIFAFNDFRRTHFSALEYFLAKCATGSLTHYIARTDGFTPPLFIETAETPQDPRVNLLRFPKSRLEERWSSVKVLSVSGLCPHWSSALYHGLVDLRLGSNIPKITESQIISILKASPGLHTLHLKNQITLETTEGTTVTRVQLNELEVLNIEDGEWHTLGNSEIVRWIQPGVKPLRFTLFGVPTPTVADFFKRSNITRFYSQRWDSFTLVDVLRMGPQLQTLVLNASDRDVETIETLVGPINEKGSLATSTPIRIHTLYLLGFKRLKLSDIQEAVNRYSVQRLFLWTCCLAYQSHTGEGTCEDETIIQQKLSEIQNCPVVEHLTCYLNPVDPGDWE